MNHLKKWLCTALCALLTACVFAGCASGAGTSVSRDVSGTDSNTESRQLNVVTTIFPHYDFARAVAGERADITMLLKPGAESHSFDPSPADIITIQEADVFIYTGGHNDAWVDNILASIDTSNMTVLRMMDYVQAVEEEIVEGMQEEEHDHDEDAAGGAELDEHIWTSPLNAITMVESVTQALIEKDPKNAEFYSQNCANYVTDLEIIDADLRSIVSAAARNLIVFGDRFPFRYFVDEYELDYRAAFPGCSADSNPSAGTVAYLIDTVREHQLPYVYTIELSTGSIANVIAEETGCGILTLSSCHNVTRDQFENGETYVSLMQQNAENLRKGLND